ncbi:MAG: EboA domain-containing protein [Bacteroidota bacterium]
MFENLADDFKSILQQNLLDAEYKWLTDAIEEIKSAGISRKLYLNYSLCGTKIQNKILASLDAISNDLWNYLKIQKASKREIARIYLLQAVLKASPTFKEPVRNLIQISDTSELETFLKYLVLLPEPENYQFAAVEAIRTNISTVFDAISKHNPYPSRYFSDQQWNQMFLKAAFMQQDLSAIVAIDERANTDLARIISDYAHERWAASRAVDPLFWRPISNFLNERLMEDVKRLFKSQNRKEQQAAALICSNSKFQMAKDLLNTYPKEKSNIELGLISWNTINE